MSEWRTIECDECNGRGSEFTKERSFYCHECNGTGHIPVRCEACHASLRILGLRLIGALLFCGALGVLIYWFREGFR